MTYIPEIQKLAKELNLQNLARGIIDLSTASPKRLEFLKDILSAELDIRKQNAMIKREKEAKLPSNQFVKTALNSGAVWQVEKLESLDWIEKDQNLIILGNCATGKTAFASHIGRKALEAGNRVAYTTLEDYLLTVRNKGRRDVDRKRFHYYLSCSLIIIDEVMYTTLTNEELTMFYQSSMLLNETRSIVLITNRELSSWQEAAEDKHLMQTLVARLTSNSQILRL